MNDPSLPTLTPWPETAFLGLGALGAPIAGRLLAAGVPLTVQNRSRDREGPLQHQPAQSPGRTSRR